MFAAGNPSGLSPEYEKNHLRDGDIYLVVVAFAALTVPAARHTFDHLLPFACATRDAADGGRQRGVARLPTHVLDLRRDGE